MTFTVAEIAVTLLAILVSFAAPGLVNTPGKRLEAIARPLYAQPWRVVAVVMFTAIVLRGALLPLVGPAVTRVHDEHSLLLQAQTLISGAFAAPAHPFWRHFESFHINVVPTHASIYFPGRGVPMAIGLWLANEPWVGIWLSMILLSGAVAWALMGWVRPSLALVGGLIVVVRFGVFSYWINAYWGGAFTALGAALAFGAMPRLWRAFDWRNGALLGIGLLILMTTRPFEGLLFSLPIAALVAWRAWRHIAGREYAAILRVALPAGLCVALGMGAILASNHAATGNYRTTPYDLNRERYAMAPAMLASDPIQPLTSPSERFRAFYEWEAEFHDRRETISGTVGSVVSKLAKLWKFYIGGALVIPLLLGAAILARGRGAALLPAISVVAGFLFVTWDFAHYVAPILVVLILAVVVGLDRLRGWCWRGRAIGAALARSLVGVCALMLAMPVAYLTTGFPTMTNNHWDAACCAFEAQTTQTRMTAQLRRLPGRDLVFVRNRPGDLIHTEWVYNEPYPDAAEIVWARDLGNRRNAALRAYYREHRHWVVNGGGRDGSLRQLGGSTSTHP